MDRSLVSGSPQQRLALREDGREGVAALDDLAVEVGVLAADQKRRDQPQLQLRLDTLKAISILFFSSSGRV